MLVFLLQINAARAVLERTRAAAWKHWQTQARLAGRLTTHARQQAAAAASAAAAAAAADEQTYLPPASPTTSTASQPRPSGLSAFILQQHQQQLWDQAAASAAMASQGSFSGGMGIGAGVPSSGKVGTASVLYAEVALGRRDELALHEMFHFVTALHQYTMERLLAGAWLRLELVCGLW
jgi:hypothetical protein